MLLLQDHFKDSDYELRRQDGLKKLRPDAVPTVFPVRGKWERKCTLISCLAVFCTSRAEPFQCSCSHTCYGCVMKEMHPVHVGGRYDF